jgi:tRNA1Val (adenine37-N6)-methyltransferase
LSEMTAEDKDYSNCTRDTIYDGRIVILQPKDGYRFSVDALLLIGFLSQDGPSDNVVDLGAGCGVVGLGLLATGLAEKVVGVELQERLAKIAAENARINGVSGRFDVYVGDIREFAGSARGHEASLVVANPPFWPVGSGRLPEHEERRIACHEVSCGIGDWVRVAAGQLHYRNGRFVTVYPARRLDALITALQDVRLSATRVRFVHPRSEEAATLVLVESRFGKPGRILVEPPLIMKGQEGEDSEEASILMRGLFCEELKSNVDRRKDPDGSAHRPT